jgi:decaprenylphospho-beta-D-ribofuranose 2-oxidase
MTTVEISRGADFDALGERSGNPLRAPARPARLSGWGRSQWFETQVLTPFTPREAQEFSGMDGFIARGNGRAYGDAAIGARATLHMRGLNRFRSFDPPTGRLSVEAGVLLSDIVRVGLANGRFPPVVPGTLHVTVGGMIAADVHGKNHHRDGGFGEHLEALTLILPSGTIIRCSPSVEPELFRATIGGMGLTGTIIEATFLLRPVETGWIRQTTLVARNLDEAMQALAGTSGCTYNVAWIDCLAAGSCLGRSLVFAGDHATRADLESVSPSLHPYPETREARASVPVDMPGVLLNRLTASAFAELYFRRGSWGEGVPRLAPWKSFFFPLDAVGDWNRIYGRRGLLQYQCVLPKAGSAAALAKLLEIIASARAPVFLAVLKQLRGGSGLMSFPMEGFTLALDLPATSGVRALLDSLDDVTIAHGGRIYLAKDARQSRAVFEAGYPGLPAFRSLRRAIGAEGRLASMQSLRLGL